MFRMGGQRGRTQSGRDQSIGRVGGPPSRPAELSHDPKLIRRQAGLAEEVKNMGAEVMLSCHTQTILRKNDAVEIVREVRQRGGQFAKIVGLTKNKADLIEMLGCVIALKRQAKIPFTVMNIGTDSVLGRLVSVQAGSSWVYCRPPTEHSYGGQPTVDESEWFLRTFGVRKA